LLIPGMILMFWAQNRVQSTYQKYAQVRSTMGMTKKLGYKPRPFRTAL
jgi:uncharacterized protein